MIDIIGVEPTLLDLIHIQITGELVYDRADHLDVRQFVCAVQMTVIYSSCPSRG